MKKHYQKNKQIRDIKHINLRETDIYKIFYRELNILYVNDNFDGTIHESELIVIR